MVGKLKLTANPFSYKIPNWIGIGGLLEELKNHGFKPLSGSHFLYLYLSAFVFVFISICICNYLFMYLYLFVLYLFVFVFVFMICNSMLYFDVLIK